MEKIEIIKYFRGNIYESYGAYNAWKMICHSKSLGIVGEEMANKYVEIQKVYPEFFGLTERAHLVTFIVLVLHPFDRRKDSCSLFKLDRKSTKAFIETHTVILESLKNVRDKLFAHKSIGVKTESLTIPSVDDLDDFYEKLVEFYNFLSKSIEDSTTLFGNAEGVKNEIENLFKNIERGECVRKKEVDLKWYWDENTNRASEKL